MTDNDSDFDFGAELATMDDIQTGSELLPEGDYNFVVKSTSTGTSSNGNPSIGLQLEIVDGPYRGKTLMHSAYYTPTKPKGIEFFWRQMKALGITSKWVRDNGVSQKGIAAAAVGVTLVAAVKHETYQEEERARTNLKKIIGTNPNVSENGAPSAVTGQVQPPAQNTLPPLEDEDEPTYTPEPVKETVPAAVDGPDGSTVNADDPWGTN